MGRELGSHPRFGQWLLALVIVALVGCSSGREPDGGIESESGSPTNPQASLASERDNQRPTIRLGVSGWATARLNVAVAEQLIERRLGYPVEPVEVFDFLTMFQDLERGEELHAVLEVWPNSLRDRELLYVEQDRVASLGELGVVGRIGWFVPAPVSEQLGVTTWRDLADPRTAAAFAPSGSSSGRLLGIDPSYEQFDQAIADELGLALEVEFSGSESRTRQEVESALAATNPILIYWWEPTELAVAADLVQVELPEWTPECEAARMSGQSAGCGYRPERLLKFGSPGLETLAPDVQLFLQEFTLTNEDHDVMLSNVADGESFGQAASSWISENQTIWEAWLGQTE